MNYRPQWMIDTPPTYEDRPYVYPLVTSPTAFLGSLTAGAFSGELPIQIQTDADFYLCAMAYSTPSNFSHMCIRLKDSFGNYLSDGWIAVAGYAFPAGINPDKGGGYAPVFDPPLLCLAGSVLHLQAFNPGTIAVSLGNIELRGFKRCRREGCDQ